MNVSEEEKEIRKRVAVKALGLLNGEGGSVEEFEADLKALFGDSPRGKAAVSNLMGSLRDKLARTDALKKERATQQTQMMAAFVNGEEL